MRSCDADTRAAAAMARLYPAAKRLWEASVSAMVLLVLAPYALVALPLALRARWLRLRARVVLGRHAAPLRLYMLEAVRPESAPARWTSLLTLLPRLLDVVRGRLALVGPRPASPEELDSVGGARHARFTVTPGLVCLWWLRCRSNIDYGSEADADAEYAAARSLRRDAAIFTRALVTLAYGRQSDACSACASIAGIRLLNLSMDSLLDAAAAALAGRVPTRIAFVNPDCVNIAARDPDYRATLHGFDWVCADGIGMKIAGSLLGRPIRQNINGTDLFPRLCAMLSLTGHSIYLLGSRPGVADAAAQWARAHFPALRIAGTRSGYFTPEEEPALVADIKGSGAAVLLVAMGVPRQEQWLSRNFQASGALLGMGVGGLFDFYSGRMPRAPLWLREMGGEWIFRLLQEPRRMWRRYLVGNWIFLYRVMVERLALMQAKERT